MKSLLHIVVHCNCLLRYKKRITYSNMLLQLLFQSFAVELQKILNHFLLQNLKS